MATKRRIPKPPPPPATPPGVEKLAERGIRKFEDGSFIGPGYTPPHLRYIPPAVGTDAAPPNVGQLPRVQQKPLTPLPRKRKPRPLPPAGRGFKGQGYGSIKYPGSV